jgi:hypothetical protein
MGKKVSLSAITGRYVGKPYHKCSCLQLWDELSRELGADFPAEYEGIDLSNFMAFWEADPDTAIGKLFEFMDTIGTAVEDFSRVQTYDFLAVEQACLDGSRNVCVAVYLSAGKILISTEAVGVRVTFLGSRNRVIKARRLL